MNYWYRHQSYPKIFVNLNLPLVDGNIIEKFMQELEFEREK